MKGFTTPDSKLYVSMIIWDPMKEENQSNWSMNTKTKIRIQNGLIQSQKTVSYFNVSLKWKNSQQKNSSEVMESCLLLRKGEYIHM